MSFNVITGLGGAVVASGAMGLILGKVSAVTGTAIMAVGVIGFSLINAYSEQLSAVGASLVGRAEKIESELPKEVKETAKSVFSIGVIGVGIVGVATGAAVIGFFAFSTYALWSMILNHRN